MKQTLLLIITLTLLNCETAEEKKNRAFNDKVFASSYFENAILQVLQFEATLKGVQEGYITPAKCITDYNNQFGFAMGYTQNLDSIKTNMANKKALYEKYLVKDAFWWHSRDSLEAVKYKAEKDSILELMK